MTVKEANNLNQKPGPTIWAVGGGKGGVGKSVISTLLGFWLSQMGKRTVLIDVDFGGANLHTMLGIKSPPKTVNDFITKKYDRLEDICIETGIENLRLLSGASEILSLANLQFAQKIKIMQSISQLDTDIAILDLGSGTSYNVLDFFLMAHRKIVVLTPQPISIQNAYAFVRNAVYRKLSRLSSQKPALLATIKTAMDPKNEMNVRTVKDLLNCRKGKQQRRRYESAQPGDHGNSPGPGDQHDKKPERPGSRTYHSARFTKISDDSPDNFRKYHAGQSDRQHDIRNGAPDRHRPVQRSHCRGV